MIKITQSGNFDKTTGFLNKAMKLDVSQILRNYGQQGVDALSSVTPVDTGLTAKSWGYKISVTKKSYSITWTNSNSADGIPVVILLHYGHGTRNGGYVQGRDFINPAIQPIMDQIAEAVWKEVTNL